MSVPPTFTGNSRSQTARLPGVSPAAAGVGLARDIGAVGEAIYRADQTGDDADRRVRQIEDQRRYETDIADAAARLALGQGDLQAKVLEMRTIAQPGAAGHEDAANQLIDQWTGEFMGSLGNPRLQTAMRDNVARVAAGLRVSEQGFALQQRAGKQVGDIEAATNSFANTLFITPSSEGLRTGIATLGTAIDATDLPADKKAQLVRDTTKLLTIRAWQGGMNANPQLALDALDAGMLNAFAEGDEIVTLRATAQARVAQQAALAERAASAQVGQFKDLARVAIEDVNGGVEVDPGTIGGYLAQARAAGDVALARDLEVAQGTVVATARLRGAPLAELDAARREIEQGPNWRGNRMLEAAHGRIGAMYEETERRAANDALGLSSENGGGLTPLVLNDRAAMVKRFTQGDQAARRYGQPGSVPQYMTEAEAAQLRTGFATGNAGDKADLINMVAQYGPDRGRALLRQIAPQEARWPALMTLATMRNRQAGMTLVREALDGWEQAKANPKLIDTNAMQAAVTRDFGSALAMIDGTTRAGVMNVATGIYAARANRDAKTRFDRNLWSESFKAALGAAGDGTGGVGRARDGSAMVLPTGASQRDFDHILARAGGTEIKTAAGGDAPLWGGRPMTAGQFKQMVPVMVSDGRYMFRNGNGYARSQIAPGRNFVLDIRDLSKGVRRMPPPPPPPEPFKYPTAPVYVGPPVDPNAPPPRRLR